ncbi:hypothetical protein MPLB_170008 [Mesorhizobium sp. ORS 3324]|nr:hypothetical protein MPLB_170008 [Mesorhizobium sp. ORS 3324]
MDMMRFRLSLSGNCMTSACSIKAWSPFVASTAARWPLAKIERQTCAAGIKLAGDFLATGSERAGGHGPVFETPSARAAGGDRSARTANLKMAR